MKNILLISTLFTFSFAFSQTETEISAIKSKVEFINSQYKSYPVVLLKTNDEKIEIFTDNLKNIKLICETYRNETGKTIIWDYIDNNQAYFILKEYFSYKLLVTDKNFNATDLIKTEEGFYFKNDRIIRWVKDKKVVKKYPKNAATIENNMIEHVADLIEKFMQQNSKQNE